ncbi:hypothetical protein E4T48_08416 [Aureobasidium sp. EXF-10727]|nr:hypothetical protein E4T48_08416 [Aureobasidium sp. EXF-10727]
MSQTQVITAESQQRPSKMLVVNDGPLHPEEIGRLPALAVDAPIEQVRKHLAEDGYIHIKGVIPRQDVLKAREEYFKLLSPTGVLQPGTEPVQGIFNEAKEARDYPGIGAGGKPGNDQETSKKFVDLAIKAHTEPWYKDVFCKHPALHEYVQKLTGWGDDTLAIQRTLLRNNTPGNKAIGVHYDQIFLRYGKDTALTAWVPMGDIAIDGGGLIYLEKGHTLGAEIEQEFTEKATAAGMSEQEAKDAFNQNMMSTGFLTDGPAEFGRVHNRRWLLTDYEAGDVVFHNTYAIHASTINHDPSNVIRLGTDLRFVNSKEQWDTRWAKSYDPTDGI